MASFSVVLLREQSNGMTTQFIKGLATLYDVMANTRV